MRQGVAAPQTVTAARYNNVARRCANASAASARTPCWLVYRHPPARLPEGCCVELCMATVGPSQLKVSLPVTAMQSSAVGQAGIIFGMPTYLYGFVCRIVIIMETKSMQERIKVAV